MTAVQVLFRVEASEILGLGHLSRCRSLALELARRFLCSPIFATIQTKTAKSFLDGLGVTIIHPDQLSGKHEFDVAITDIPGLCLNEQRWLGELASLHVGINDDDPGPFAYDILIRPNLLDLPIPATEKKTCDYWKGREYIILHPDFALRRPSSAGRLKVENMLVCFGGSDPAGLTLRVIPILAQVVQDVNVHIVLGSAFTGKEAVSALIAAMPNVSLTVNCSTIAEALSRADVALISGGTLMYEACVLGVPTLVLCQNEPQHQEAEILAGGGAVINLGMHSQVNDERIVSAIKIMLGDTAQRQRLSVTARRLVPSNGTSHIGSKIARRLAWNQALKR